MKTTPVLLGVISLALLAAPPAHAQTTEKIALYADRLGTDCSVTDNGVGEIFVYMFHVGTGMRTGAAFRAVKPACWVGATWVGDERSSAIYFTHGSTQDTVGLEVGYFGCVPLPVYIGKMLFDATGAAEPCCVLAVLPSLFYGAVIGVDCESRARPILGGSVVINEDASCPCSSPLALETTTWGRVKSLYH